MRIHDVVDVLPMTATMTEGLAMNRVKIQSFRVRLSSWCVAPVRLSEMRCRYCRYPLDIHQPDPKQPDQFLATCGRCGRWFRVESKMGSEEATLIQLPTLDDLGPPPLQPESEPAH